MAKCVTVYFETDKDADRFIATVNDSNQTIVDGPLGDCVVPAAIVTSFKRGIDVMADRKKETSDAVRG
jgi:hypothetical protein